MPRMSKLQKTETNLHLPEHQPEFKEKDHPRKKAVKTEDTSSTTPEPVEEKDHPTTNRHPQGHRVKTMDDVTKFARKNKYLPLAEQMNCGDVYYQPIKVEVGGKNVLTVTFEELINGDEIKLSEFAYSIAADDLLKMFYLAERFANVYYSMETEDYELWFVHQYSELLQDCRNLDISDHGMIAEKLLIKHGRNLFILGKFSMMEVYFQKHCVHEYTGQVGIENPNIVKCKSLKGKFEYIIEARVFVLNEKIHDRKLGDIMGATQPL